MGPNAVRVLQRYRSQRLRLAITTEQWLRHKGSVGKAIHGEIHILDEDGNELPTNETGIIYFANGSDFSYYKDPEKTRQAKVKQGWSTLGDIGYLDEDGYLYLKDRLLFMIISGGVNIYPQEIEDLLITHRAVYDVAVFGVPNTEFGEEVKAVIQLIEPGESLRRHGNLTDQFLPGASLTCKVPPVNRFYCRTAKASQWQTS